MNLGSIRCKTRKAPRIQKPTLRSVYGEVILRKGTILYHASQQVFRPNPTKPMLFTTIHPSEWSSYYDEYITPIILKRDISLLFMTNGIINTRILPLLDTLINQPGNNIAKQKDTNLACYTRYLKTDSFDGWISSIEGKSTIEVALINDMILYEPLPSVKLIMKGWHNSDYNADGVFIPKKWGTLYPVSTLHNPAIFNINKRYKENIDAYIAYCERVCPNEFAFQLLLSNATINYIDAPTAFIHWAC
jgi:hypothetical protein